jgi:hypothetical protein
MSDHLLNILAANQNDEKLGTVAKEALEFVKGTTVKSWQSPGTGQSSLSVANIYKIRMKHETYRPEAFLGLEDSISSLAAKDVTVHLSVIETEQGLVSVWLVDDQSPPVGIIVGKFLPQNKSGDEKFDRNLFT